MHLNFFMNARIKKIIVSHITIIDEGMFKCRSIKAWTSDRCSIQDKQPLKHSKIFKFPMGAYKFSGIVCSPSM